MGEPDGIRRQRLPGPGGRGLDDAPARRDSRYSGLVRDVSTLLESARSASARAVNTLITATYWEIGRRIVEFEQGGARRAAYGTELLDKLSADLTRRFGRGFSRDKLETMRL